MNALVCEREQELLDALGRGYVGDELGAHARECDACGELRIVAEALLTDRAEASEHPIPASGTMWWRMRVRQRNDAQTVARRALFVGQALTLIVALALVVTFFGDGIAAAGKSVIATLHIKLPVAIAAITAIVLAALAFEARARIEKAKSKN